MVTVGHSCEVHLLIKGLVDAHKEIERLNGLIGEKQSGQRKLFENTQAGDYEKVPIEVRDANKEKVRRPWGLCGEAMGLMWGGHGAYVGRPWGLCGEAMGLMWGGHGAYVGRPWGLCGEAMGLMWGGRGAYVGRPWGLCGEAMGLMWGGHGAYISVLV